MPSTFLDLLTSVDVLTFVGIFAVGILLWAALSPFETLGWWAGWFGDEVDSQGIPSDGVIRVAHEDAAAYLVYLSGIGRVSGVTLSRREAGFLQRLAAALPDVTIIDDIFPYAVNNRALTGQRFFAWLWRLALRNKYAGPQVIGYLINVRNIWQIMISADKRYGPLYNQSMAEVILTGLARYDYRFDHDAPIIIVAYSGAGQMAVGAATYLKQFSGSPVYVISLGGVWGSDPGLLAADHVYHLYGTEDHAHGYGRIAPGRWPIYATSDFNRALRKGNLTFRAIGPMQHTGAQSYLDIHTALADGTSYMDKTVQTVAGLVEDIVARHADLEASESSVDRTKLMEDSKVTVTI